VVAVKSTSSYQELRLINHKEFKMRLNQLLAIEKGLRQQVQKDLTELHRAAQKDELYDGLEKTYTPNTEEGEQLPPESKVIQQRAEDIFQQVAKMQSRVINLVSSKDITNTKAIGTITANVGGHSVEVSAPVTHLLWLDKTLEDLHTFVVKMPTLDPSTEWARNEQQDCMSTKPVKTIRTKKTPKNHVLYEATKEHPAQVQTYTEDIPVGSWSTIRYSGRLSVERKNQLLERIRALQEAVKKAREQANLEEVAGSTLGNVLMDWLFK
jgi:hypothetical protein